MFRLPRAAGAVLLAALLGAGTSTGPAFGEETPTAPTSTTAPATTTEAPPATTEPTAPTTEPSPIESPPAQPAASEQVTDLKVSASFDRSNYAAHEPVGVRASVANVGDTAVTFRLTSTGNLTNHRWKQAEGQQLRVEPGQTLDAVLNAFVEDVDQEVLTVVVTVEPVEFPDADPTDNTATISVPVTRVYGSYRRTVYGDLDGDGVLDPGEELAGHPVHLSGGRPQLNHTTTTDAAGRFAFTDLPAGEYSISAGYLSPWYFGRPGSVVVDGVDDPDIVFRGVGRVRDAVSATLAFDRQDYHEGDTARLTATLVNNGPVPIHGLTGAFQANDGSTIDPGELGTGISVPTGATRSVTVSFPIGHAAWALGHVSVYFSFGAPPLQNGGTGVTALARVPGGRAPLVAGYLAEFHWECPSCPPIGSRMPGLVIFLRDHFTGALVARTTTGPDGGFTFTDLPAGPYDVFVVGPWQYRGDWSTFVVTASENGTPLHVVLLLPGPDRPDPGPVPPPPADPAPAPGPAPQPATPVLASTGVSPGIAWLALGGLLLLTTGTALLLHPRLVRTRR
ncbi:SdrD B-like domain-containing protein [Actinosynnema sp. NPDC051121]